MIHIKLLYQICVKNTTISYFIIFLYKLYIKCYKKILSTIKFIITS
jgi:hypothetical protein